MASPRFKKNRSMSTNTRSENSSIETTKKFTPTITLPLSDNEIKQIEKQWEQTLSNIGSFDSSSPSDACLKKIFADVYTSFYLKGISKSELKEKLKNFLMKDLAADSTYEKLQIILKPDNQKLYLVGYINDAEALAEMKQIIGELQTFINTTHDLRNTISALAEKFLEKAKRSSLTINDFLEIFVLDISKKRRSLKPSVELALKDIFEKNSTSCIDREEFKKLLEPLKYDLIKLHNIDQSELDKLTNLFPMPSRSITKAPDNKQKTVINPDHDFNNRNTSVNVAGAFKTYTDSLNKPNGNAKQAYTPVANKQNGSSLNNSTGSVFVTLNLNGNNQTSPVGNRIKVLSEKVSASKQQPSLAKAKSQLDVNRNRFNSAPNSIGGNTKKPLPQIPNAATKKSPPGVAKNSQTTHSAPNSPNISFSRAKK